MPPTETSPTTRPSVFGAIPARFGSTRLPGKPLLPLAGRPMIEHVYRRAARVAELARVVVLTDDERIRSVVEGFGGEVQMTPSTCQSGTDRIAWAARDWDAEAVVNIQGDEPLVDPEDIARLARHLADRPGDPMATLACPAEPGDLDDPNVVKVVFDRRGYALYFSRSRIPYPRAPEASPSWRHLGLYAYRREALLELAALEPTPLERAESLEQLRALENGVRIRVLETRSAAPGLDTPDDARRLETLLLSDMRSD